MKQNYFAQILKNNNVILAPMAGITFDSYRTFMSLFNVGMFYTEMISDKGLIYGSKETYMYLPTEKSVRPLGIQLFGSSPETIVKAIKLVEKNTTNYDFIDINMGCSVPKVSKGGAGSILLKDLDLAESIVKAAVKASSKPVSVKVRLGWDQNDIENIVRRFTGAGAQLIAIHPRYATQMFKDKPHWNLIKNIQTISEVPIVISGDIYTIDDARSALEITNAMGVMVARGGVGSPLLCQNIYEHFHNLEITKNDLKQQKKNALLFIELVCAEKGEYNGVKILRGLLPKFFQDYPNAKQDRVLITQTIAKEKLITLINSINE